MNLLANYIINEKDISSNSHIAKHEKWVKDILTHRNDITCDNIFSVLQDEIGKAFIKVLEDAGVYKLSLIHIFHLVSSSSNFFPYSGTKHRHVILRDSICHCQCPA